MKIIKTNQTLNNLLGEPLTNSDDEKVTIGVVLSNILSGRVKDFHWGYKLATKFAGDKEVSLSAQDIVMITDELKKSDATALIAGQIVEILDGSPDEDSESKKSNKK